METVSQDSRPAAVAGFQKVFEGLVHKVVPPAALPAERSRIETENKKIDEQRSSVMGVLDRFDEKNIVKRAMPLREVTLETPDELGRQRVLQYKEPTNDEERAEFESNLINKAKKIKTNQIEKIPLEDLEKLAPYFKANYIIKTANDRDLPSQQAEALQEALIANFPDKPVNEQTEKEKNITATFKVVAESSALGGDFRVILRSGLKRITDQLEETEGKTPQEVAKLRRRFAAFEAANKYLNTLEGSPRRREGAGRESTPGAAPAGGTSASQPQPGTPASAGSSATPLETPRVSTDTSEAAMREAKRAERDRRLRERDQRLRDADRE